MRKVSPKLQPWLDDFNKNLVTLVASGFKANTINAREYLANLTRDLITDIPDIARIYDDSIFSPDYQVPVRIYHPQPKEALPVLLYFHGGGHMVGSVTVYDPICRKMALASKHIVVSVEYRLTPENPYPCGVQDAYWAAKNVFQTLSARGIAFKPELSVGGDSAGGALSAAVIHKAQFDYGLNIKKAVLIYPGLDYTLSCPSIKENAVGFLLQTAKIAWYYDNYFLNAEDREAASPLFGSFTKGLPEIFVISAEFCPLRDENLAYVAKLKAAGIRHQHLHFDDMVHTFLNMESLVKEECRKVYTEVGAFLNS